MKISQYDIKAFLFDKDGTIFDSEALHSRGWVESAKHFNVTFTAQMYQDFAGCRIAECYKIAHKMFGEAFPMEDFIAYNDHWVDEKKAKGIAFKTGFQPFFEQVKQCALPIALVTSASEAATQLSFKSRPELFKSFQLRVTGDQVAKPKPDPRCYLMACEQLNVAPKNTLVFEDSIAGITAGINAGCNVVAIPDLLTIPQALLDQCAFVFESFEQARVIFQSVK